jgi:hypothetical protein
MTCGVGPLATEDIGHRTISGRQGPGPWAALAAGPNVTPSAFSYFLISFHFSVLVF